MASPASRVTRYQGSPVSKGHRHPGVCIPRSGQCCPSQNGHLPGRDQQNVSAISPFGYQPDTQLARGRWSSRGGARPARPHSCALGTMVGMTIIKINAITVAADSGSELAKRFAARAGAIDDQDGFEGFELLQPTDDRTTWLVVTRWRDEDAFNAWVSSPAFGAGHQGADKPAPHGGPVSTHSELWSYEVALTADAAAD